METSLNDININSRQISTSPWHRAAHVGTPLRYVYPRRCVHIHNRYFAQKSHINPALNQVMSILRV